MNLLVAPGLQRASAIHDLLSATIGYAERICRAERVTGQERVLEDLERMFVLAQEAQNWPTEGEPRLVNDLTIMLLQCLRNAEREPLGGNLHWILIAKVLLPLVRPELARAIEKLRPTV
jgi:hypothetical protein